LNLIDEDFSSYLLDEDFENEYDNTVSLENLDINYDNVYHHEKMKDSSSDKVDNDFFNIWQWYWQICTPKRAYKCITKFGAFVPKISNHMMANYLSSISKTSVFYTRDNVKEVTLKDAIIASCKEEN